MIKMYLQVFDLFMYPFFRLASHEVFRLTHDHQLWTLRNSRTVLAILDGTYFILPQAFLRLFQSLSAIEPTIKAPC